MRAARTPPWAPAVSYLRDHLPVWRARRGRTHLGALGGVLPADPRNPAGARLVPADRHGAQPACSTAARSRARRTALWLERTAVQFVLLTPFPLDDHGAAAEARLVRSARLRAAQSSGRIGGFTIYSARRRAQLMTGAADVRLTTFSHDRDRRARAPRRRGDAARQLLAVLGGQWIRHVRRARPAAACRRCDSPVAGHFSLRMTRDPLTIAHRVTDADC